MAASVVDLRRLGDGSRLISAALDVAGGMAAGEHDATLEVSGADQVTTTFTGTPCSPRADGPGRSRPPTAAATPATGSFTCATEAVETTTTQADAAAGEEVPDTTGVTT